MSVTFDGILANLEKSISADQEYTSLDDASNVLLQSIQGLVGMPVSDLTLSSVEFKKSPESPVVDGSTLYGYAAWHFGADGDYFIDSWGDVTCPNSWADCIQEAEQTKRNTKRDWLMPHLYNHDKNALIGAVVKLQEDTKGVYYETKLANTNRAREVKNLASDGMLGCSYGYNPLVVQHVYHERAKKTIRKLVKVHVSELSACVMPANPYATANVKALLHQHLQYNTHDAVKTKKLFTQLDDALTRLQLDAYRMCE